MAYQDEAENVAQNMKLVTPTAESVSLTGSRSVIASVISKIKTGGRYSRKQKENGC